MGSVKIESLTKKFGDTKALDNVQFDIQEGEFFALLGPSGCGKTTTMRCIAGFESPSEGVIYIGDRKVNDVAPNQRNCGMVFQSYALFPHMNVFDNVAYSLNIKNLKSAGFGGKFKTYGRLVNRKFFKYPPHIKDKVMEMLEYVELDHLSDRLISELSGGQQQRVALARALVMEPAVLLMDEPLSNLDQKLRHTMRNTIRKIQQELGITTIFVTHDQEEAMSMADRVAVMDKGQVIQIGTPTELYSHPKNPFIADFVGTSNIIKGKVTRKKNGYSYVKFADVEIKSTTIPEENDVDLIIRPENMNIVTNEAVGQENTLQGKVLFSTYLGSIVRYDVQVDDYVFILDTTYHAGDKIYHTNDEVTMNVSPEKVLLI